jgi:hypothetical protein
VEEGVRREEEEGSWQKEEVEEGVRREEEVGSWQSPVGRKKKLKKV